MITTTYLRHRGAIGSGKFTPLGAEHPLVGTQCVCCEQVFKAGDVTTLVALGPGVAPDEREKCRGGGFYTAVAISIHHACATGVVDG